MIRHYARCIAAATPPLFLLYSLLAQLARNPLEDIGAVREAVAVFRGDRWYDPALLYEAVGIRPFTR